MNKQTGDGCPVWNDHRAHECACGMRFYDDTYKDKFEMHSELRRTRDERDALRVRVNEMQEVLEFYGDVMNWRTRHAPSNISISQRMDDVIRDDDVHYDLGWSTGGKRARAVLEKYKVRE